MTRHRIVSAFLLAFAVTFAVSPTHAHDVSDDAAGGSATDQMGKHMHAGPHMTMTDPRPVTPADVGRGQEILKTMRAALAKYEDSNTAIADGYVPFMPSVPQDVYHFANREFGAAEYAGNFDLAKPGSLLYSRKTFGGYRLVGAMYSAPAEDSLSQLDEMIPLGLAQWHAHTNICLPQGVTMADVFNGDVRNAAHGAALIPRAGVDRVSSAMRMRLGYLADDRFGFEGKISDTAECESVGGTFHKQIFGWMVHVYPFAGDDLKVAFGHDAP